MYDCNKCKNLETDICCGCSLFDGDRHCSCHTGNPPCGYCENILFKEKDMVKYTIDGRIGEFNSILEIDKYRKNHPKANGVVWTHDGHQVNEDHVRQLELKKTQVDIKLLEEMGWMFLQTGGEDWEWIKFVEGHQIAVQDDLTWLKDNKLISNKLQWPDIELRKEWDVKPEEPIPPKTRILREGSMAPCRYCENILFKEKEDEIIWPTEPDRYKETSTKPDTNIKAPKNEWFTEDGCRDPLMIAAMFFLFIFFIILLVR